MTIKTIIKKPDCPACEFGCPVTIRRILKENWDTVCTNGGVLTSLCTEPETVLMEIQPPETSDGGEKISCKINGLTLDVNYQFWYTPTPPQPIQQDKPCDPAPPINPEDVIYLTTPLSCFKVDGFDASQFYGGWTVVNYLGCDYVVIQLMNDTGGCDDNHDIAFNVPQLPCDEPPATLCNTITQQRGYLVPLQECSRSVDTTEPLDSEFCVDDGWTIVQDTKISK